MCLGKEPSESQKGEIIAAKRLGHTNSAISKVIGCSCSSVRRVLESYELGNPLKKQTGRPRIFNKSERQCLADSVVRNKKACRQSLFEIRLNYIDETNKPISTQTIRKELAKKGLHSRIPRPSPLISEGNKRKRYLWARAHKNWTIEDFK